MYSCHTEENHSSAMLNKAEKRNYQIAVAAATGKNMVDSQYLFATDPRHEIKYPLNIPPRFVAYICGKCKGAGVGCNQCSGKGLV